MSGKYFGSRRCFQIGRSGEGNLPPKQLKEVEDKDLKTMLLRSNRHVGYFLDPAPYIPWPTEDVGAPFKLCSCDCHRNETKSIVSKTRMNFLQIIREPLQSKKTDLSD